MIAPAAVLSNHATVNQVVLVARAVDEHVDLIGRLGTGGQTPRCAVEPIILDAGTGGESRKIEKVATRARQVVDLLLSNVGRDFGGAHFDCWCRYNLDTRQLHR